MAAVTFEVLLGAVAIKPRRRSFIGSIIFKLRVCKLIGEANTLSP